MSWSPTRLQSGRPSLLPRGWILSWPDFPPSRSFFSMKLTFEPRVSCVRRKAKKTCFNFPALSVPLMSVAIPKSPRKHSLHSCFRNRRDTRAEAPTLSLDLVEPASFFPSTLLGSALCPGSPVLKIDFPVLVVCFFSRRLEPGTFLGSFLFPHDRLFLSARSLR